MTKDACADVCIVVEGCYPFVMGGVSTWLDWLLRTQADTRFAIVAITADARARDILYDLPDNVISFQTIPLAPPARRPRLGEPRLDGAAYGQALVDLWQSGDAAAFERLCHLVQTPVRRGVLGWPGQAREPDHADMLSSAAAWEALCYCHDQLAPEAPFFRRLLGLAQPGRRADVSVDGSFAKCQSVPRHFNGLRRVVRSTCCPGLGRKGGDNRTWDLYQRTTDRSDPGRLDQRQHPRRVRSG